MRDSLRILPPDLFKNVFDVGLHNVSIIANLFDCYKPYALSTHNRIRVNKMHHIGEALRFGINKI